MKCKNCNNKAVEGDIRCLKHKTNYERVKQWKIDNLDRAKNNSQNWYKNNKEKVKKVALKRKPKLTENKQEIVLKLLQQGLSYNKIEKLVGSQKKDISAFAKSVGLERKTNKDLGKNLIEYTCEFCGNKFKEYESAKRRFCSSECGDKNRIRWTKEQIQNNIKDLSDVNGYVKSTNNQILVSVASRMFGSWDKACESLGYKRIKDKHEICLICGKDLKRGSYKIRFCSIECQKKAQNPRWSSYWHIRRSKYSKGDIIDKNLIYERDSWICHICGDVINPSFKHPNPFSASLDHIIPLSKGGKHEFSNVKAAHLTCNCRKSDKLK